MSPSSTAATTTGTTHTTARGARRKYVLVIDALGDVVCDECVRECSFGRRRESSVAPLDMHARTPWDSVRTLMASVPRS